MTGRWLRCWNQSAEDFWEIAEDRYQTRSMILTAQLPVSRWHEQIGIPRWPTGSSTGWCTTPIVSRCAANRCENLGGEGGKSDQSSAGKSCGKAGKSALGNRSAIPTFPQLRRRPHLSLDDRDHFLQNPPASVASLRRLITSLRNADHDQPGIDHLHRIDGLRAE